MCECRRMLAPIIVTSNADNTISGDGLITLREAIAAANQLDDLDTITFDPAVFNTPKTILLTEGQLTITQSVTINGMDANGVSRNITIDGSGSDPTPDSTFDDGNPNNDGDGITVLRIQPASSNPQFKLAGLKITGGDANLFAGGIVYYG